MHLGIRLIKYTVPPKPESSLKQEVGGLVKKYTFVRRIERPVVKSVKLLSDHSYSVLRENPSHHFHV
jgi:hypothetical protein